MYYGKDTYIGVIVFRKKEIVGSNNIQHYSSTSSNDLNKNIVVTDTRG